MVALQIYISGSVESWTVAGAFGQRRFVALTILLVSVSRRCRRAAATSARGRRDRLTVARCVWWNLALMAEFGPG